MHVYLCDFLLDITQNSIEAGATLVEVEISEAFDEMRFTITDNGKGMSREVMEKALDPFYTDGVKHSRRKVGLGLPFLKQSSKSFELQSQPGKGTTVRFSFDLTDMDTPPVGDMAGTMLVLFNCCPESCNLVFRRKRESSKGELDYTISREDLIDALGELRTAGSLSLAREFLQSQEDSLSEVEEDHVLKIPAKENL